MALICDLSLYYDCVRCATYCSVRDDVVIVRPYSSPGTDINIVLANHIALWGFVLYCVYGF